MFKRLRIIFKSYVVKSKRTVKVDFLKFTVLSMFNLHLKDKMKKMHQFFAKVQMLIV